MSERNAKPGMTDDRIRILHVITGLDVGGAETFLYNLAVSLSQHIDSRILSLSAGGGLVLRFRDAGMKVVQLGLKGRTGLLKIPGAAMRVAREVREWHPHVIQGWLNHGNVAATFVRGQYSRSSALIWSIRQSIYDIGVEKPGTQRAIRLQVRLSSRPDAIICNSSCAKEQLIQLGFARKALDVIPNGFDTMRFRPRTDARAQMRALIGATEEEFVVGMVARLHRLKDYPTFIRAVSLAAATMPRLKAVCIGPGVAARESPLRSLVGSLGLEQRCILLDQRADMEFVYPGFDLMCLTSVEEGFPNVVGEAMACGVPCIATDVGDTAKIIADTGVVVMPGDPEPVARAIVELASLEDDTRAGLAMRARERIARLYSMPSIAGKYMSMYLNQAGGSDVVSGLKR